MKILQVLLSTSVDYGGPAAVVRNLTQNLVDLGVETSVVTLAKRNSLSLQFADDVSVRTCGIAVLPKLGLPMSHSLIGALLDESKTSDLVHLHDMWHLPQLVGAFTSRLKERPYVVSPHGALEPWCFEQHRISKAAAWRFYEKRILNEAKRVHALTEEEKRTVQRLGVESMISIIPSGVNLQTIDEFRQKARSESDQSKGEQTPFILYIGRIHPKKQLDIVLDSFERLAIVDREISLVITGPDPDGLWASMRSRLQKANLTKRVRYLGFVDEVTKFRLMTSAALFVQASKTEGLSMAILEAMACGTPVIVSAGCNIPEVQEYHAGYVVPDKPQAFLQAITRALNDEALRKSMRTNARRLVEEKFTARATASEMKKVYRESLDQHDSTRRNARRA
jgi:glycosyltransferase involved in cell wall biosynthesis